MAPDNLALHLELNDGDGLVHLGCQPRIHRIIDILIQNLRNKALARIIVVNPGREHGQRTEIDTVAVFQHIEAVVADRNAQHIADAGQVAGCRSHPGNIMVSPLDIHIMELHQLFHNNIRPGASVKNVADNMQAVDCQILNQFTQRDNKFISDPDVDDRTDNLAVVYPFIVIIIIHMKKFIDHIGKFRRHFLSHLGTGVFGRNHLADLDQTVNGNSLPVVRRQALQLHLAHHPLGIVDHVSQFHLFFFRNNMSECLRDLFPDNTGSTAEQMDKCLILSVQVTEKVLGSLWKPLNRR